MAGRVGEQVQAVHRDAVRATRSAAVPATTVRHFMPGLKRQSHVTRILNSLARSGALARAGYQERGRFVVTYGLPGGPRAAAWERSVAHFRAHEIRIKVSLWWTHVVVEQLREGSRADMLLRDGRIDRRDMTPPSSMWAEPCRLVLMSAADADIPRKAEAEQAFVIFKLLKGVLQHGTFEKSYGNGRGEYVGIVHEDDGPRCIVCRGPLVTEGGRKFIRARGTQAWPKEGRDNE